MPAIITDKVRRSTTEHFYKLFTEANDAGQSGSPSSSGEGVWIGIGRSQPYAANEGATDFSVPYPGSMPFDEELVRENVFSLVRGEVQYLIPRNRLIQGRRYKKYDPTDWSCFYPSNAEDGSELLPCYVEVNRRIYLILQNGGGSALPTATLPNAVNTIQTFDGFTFAYVTEVPSDSKFYTPQFVEIPEKNSDALDYSNDPSGFLYGFKVVSGGSGYAAGNTATIRGVDASGNYKEYTDRPITLGPGGSITGITLPTLAVGDSNLTGWKKASVRITGIGTGAHIVPLIGPVNGFANPANDIKEHLPVWFLGVTADFEGKVEGAAKIIPFRQISVIYNPDRDPTNESNIANGQLIPDENAMDGLRYFVLDSSPSETPNTGTVILETATGSRAYFDRYREVDINGTPEHRFYFHESSFSPTADAFPNFSANGTITIGNVSYTYTSIGEPEYVRGTGDVLFVENRNRIDRSVSQTEEIKVVIQF